MRHIRGLLVVAALFVAATAEADPVVKVGPEFQINTYTTGDQDRPSVAARPDGSYIVVWQSREQFASGSNLKAQILAANGSTVGAEFLVSTSAKSPQLFPDVAADGRGRFVVVWSAYSEESFEDVLGQLFDSSGAAVGAQIEVNALTAESQSRPAVAMAGSGDFFVVWQEENQESKDRDIYGRPFDSTGAAMGLEFRVNDTTSMDQESIRVVATESGYAVTWESFLQDGSVEGTFLRFLAADGSPASGELQVNSFTVSDQEDPDIAVAADGKLAVVWESRSQDGWGDGIFAQALDSNGTPIGGEIQLNTYTPGDQADPSVSADGTGGFVASWDGPRISGEDGDEDVFIQRFDTAGELVGGELQPNIGGVLGNQGRQRIASASAERFLVIWESSSPGQSDEVFGQLFDVAIFADGFESGDVSAWSTQVP